MRKFVVSDFAEKYQNIEWLSDEYRELFLLIIESDDLKALARSRGTTITTLTRDVKFILRKLWAFTHKITSVTQELLDEIHHMDKESAISYLFWKWILSPYSDNMFIYRELWADILNSVDIRKSYLLTIELIRAKKWLTKEQAIEALQDNTLSEILSWREIYSIDRDWASLENCMCNNISLSNYD
jgi:hypothetical protein